MHSNQALQYAELYLNSSQAMFGLHLALKSMQHQMYYYVLLFHGSLQSQPWVPKSQPRLIQQWILRSIWSVNAETAFGHAPN